MNVEKIKPYIPVAEKFLAKQLPPGSIFFALRKENKAGNTYFISALGSIQDGEYKEEIKTLSQLIAKSIPVPGVKKMLGEIDESIKNAVLSMENANGFYCKTEKGKLFITTGIFRYYTNEKGEGIAPPSVKLVKRMTLSELISSL